MRVPQKAIILDPKSGGNLHLAVRYFIVSESVRSPIRHTPPSVGPRDHADLSVGMSAFAFSNR